MEYQSKKRKPTFYNQVLAHVHRKFLKKIGRENKLPFMAQKEIDVITDILASMKPQRCLEWGSGYSTKLFAGLLDRNSTWQAIEHIEEWFNTLSTLNLPAQASVDFIPPDILNETTGTKEEYVEGFTTYVQKPSGKFDFILVDGRSRNECVKRAFDLITEEGIVVLHDANRKRYRKNLAIYPYQFLLTDHRKRSGGLWLGSKSEKVMKMIDLTGHVRLWKLHLLLLRLLRPFHRYKVGN